MSDAASTASPPWWRAVAAATAGVAVVVGLGLLLIAVTLGRCDAFGGTCPADPPPLLEDDVFGMAALGAAMCVAVPAFVFRPSRRRLLVAVAAGALAALLIGLAARSSAYG